MLIRGGNQRGLTQIAFAFGRFLGEDVVTIRLAMLVTLGGPAKSFRRATIGLEFRHVELR